MDLREECKGYGIAYLDSDKECAICDFRLRCKFETDKKFRKEKEKIMSKLLKELKKLKKKTDLEEFVEDNDLEDYVDLDDFDSVKEMKEGIKDAIEEKEEDPDGDEDGDPDGDEDGDPDGDEDGDPDGDEDGDNDFEERILELESKIATLEKLISSKTSSKKMSTEDKEAIKKSLMKKVPYTAKSLEKLNGKEIKFLASAMEIKSFGKSRKEVAGLILKSKKNKKKK